MIRFVAGVIAALALVLGVALPAEAAPSDSVLVSADGSHFSSTLPGGLFPASTVLIPGANRTATLYVKNDSSVPSELFVTAAHVVVSSADFARALTLRATSPASPSNAAVPLSRAAQCAGLLAEVLAPGAVTKLTLTLTMADVAAQVAQGASLSATLGLALYEADTSVAPVSGCDLTGVQLPVLGLPADSHGGGLAFTGSAVLYPALVAVGILLGVGTWLFLAGRRRGRRSR